MHPACAQKVGWEDELGSDDQEVQAVRLDASMKRLLADTSAAGKWGEASCAAFIGARPRRIAAAPEWVLHPWAQ